MIGKLLANTLDVGMDHELKRDDFLLPPSPPVTRSPEPLYNYSISPVRPGEEEELDLYADDSGDDKSSKDLTDPDQKLKFGKLDTGVTLGTSPSSSALQFNGRQVLTELKIHVKSEAAAVIEKEAKLPLGLIYGRGGKRFSLNNVRIPRRQGEGTTAIFDRPELKDSIRLRMEESHRVLVVELKESIVKDKKDDNNGAEQIVLLSENSGPTFLKMPPPPPPPPPPQILTLPQPPPPPVLKIVDLPGQRSRSSSKDYRRSTKDDDGHHSSRRTDNKRRSSGSALSSSRGSSGDKSRRRYSDDDDDDRSSLRKQKKRETRNERPRRRSREHSSRSPVSRNIISQPTSILHVDWMGAHIPNLIGKRIGKERLIEGLYTYFYKLGQGAKLLCIKNIVGRPRESWLVYDTVEDASKVKKLVEGLTEQVFTFHDIEMKQDYRIPYRVEFTTKCEW